MLSLRIKINLISLICTIVGAFIILSIIMFLDLVTSYQIKYGALVLSLIGSFGFTLQFIYNDFKLKPISKIYSNKSLFESMSDSERTSFIRNLLSFPIYSNIVSISLWFISAVMMSVLSYFHLHISGIPAFSFFIEIMCAGLLAFLIQYNWFKQIIDNIYNNINLGPNASYPENVPYINLRTQSFLFFCVVIGYLVTNSNVNQHLDSFFVTSLQNAEKISVL